MRAILFPGQGAQWVGMGQDFFADSPAAREVFERADAALGMELSQICFAGPEDRLAETDICQPAILTCSAAIVSAMEERGQLRRDEFAAAAGLSLGEYTALWFAGALSFEDAVRLVRARGRGMQDASEQSPSGMISLLGASEEQAAALCQQCAEGDVLVPANYLAPGNLAVSGANAALDRAEAAARELGIRRAVRLKVAGAFHSPLMAPAGPVLEEALAGVQLRSPTVPVISNVTAAAHGAEQSIRETLVKQVTSPVLWERSILHLRERGIERSVEPGPGSVLTGLLRKIDRQLTGVAVGRVGDLQDLVREAAGE